MTIVLVAQTIAVHGQSDPPTTGNILEDARQIIASKKGEIRIWHHAPRVLILTDDPEIISRTNAILERMENAITPGYGDVLFGPVMTRPFPKNFGHGAERLEFRLRRDENNEIAANLRLGDGAVLKVDLVIAVGHRPNIAVLNGLWGMSPNHNRAQMSGGRARCFYSSRSKNGRRLGAYVSIVDHSGFAEDTAECLWEEILHAMGPLIDAKGSPFFTFDDQAGSTERKKQNDILLLKAMYESGTEAGEGPEKTLRVFADLLDQRR